jgi:hypothetical protein
MVSCGSMSDQFLEVERIAVSIVDSPGTFEGHYVNRMQCLALLKLWWIR